MQNTTNFNLKKPGYTDPVDIEDINDNMDIIDNEIAAHKADGASHSKTAKFVIGTSTAGWTSKDVDYLCDGTADDVEINAAITALPVTGGEIVILDGTYNITVKIDVTKNNVSIRGNGNATILKRMFDSSAAKEGVITLSGRSGCKIANLQVDGNKTTYININNHGIYLSSSSNNTVTNNTCNNNSSGIYLIASSDNTITGNTCNNNSSGIYLGYSSRNTITDNTCNNNSTGIYLTGSTISTVTGNTCIRGNGLTTDYTVSEYTIRLGGAGNQYILISNNNCMGKAVTDESGTGNTLVNNKFDDSDDIQALAEQISTKVSQKTYTTTITTSWIGSSAPYMQDITITGIPVDFIPTVSPIYSVTLSTALLQKEAWGMVSKIETGTNKITVTCFEDKPIIAIPIQLVGVI